MEDNIFKVKCTNNDGGHHTINKIYLFKNGVLESDDNPNYLRKFDKYASIDDINKQMFSRFELYEDTLNLKEQVLEWVKKDVLILESKRNSYVLMTDGRLLGFSGGDNLNSYNNDLEYTDEKAHSITKIFKLKYAFGDICTLGESMKNKKDCFLIWERKKPKYTIQQLQEKIGEEFELIL